MFINRYLIQFAKGSGRLVAVACLYELVLTALGTGISLCCAFASRMILGDEGVPLFTNVVQIFCCIAVGLIIRFILSKQKVIKANQCSIQIKDHLRKELMAKMFDLGPAFTTGQRTGDIANTISSKVEWLSYYYTLYLPTVISALINAVILIGVLLQFDWLIALICCIACIGMIVCPMSFYHMMKERGNKEWEAHTAYYADCLDSIQGMTTLKAFNANHQRRDYIHRKGEELRQCVMAQLRVSMLENGVLELLARLGSAFSVAVAVVRSITVGYSDSLIYILFIAGACFAPMMNLVNAWHMGYRGITASYSIQGLLDERAVLSLNSRTSQTKSLDGGTGCDITFDHVNFAYSEGDGDVLHDISFQIPKGTMTALVGPSGGGKSTIAHLLAGFYPVRSGSVRVGDAIVGEETVAEVQAMISAVWQDSHIFYGTVMDNIRMGRPDATDEEVVNASKQANLHDLVVSLPDGYHTLLGENGMRFSGGERQRIALARAFLKNSAILIFDEATSSLDRKNELEIQRSFDRLRQGKTSLVIAHRLSTIRQANQICIIESGRIIASGTHEELARTSSAYRALMGGQLEVSE